MTTRDTTAQTRAERFFEDCARNNLRPTDGRLVGWLWFSCPAHLRAAVRPLIEADPRLVRGQTPAQALREEAERQ